MRPSTLRPCVASLVSSSSSTGCSLCATIARLTSASSASGSVRAPSGVTPLTLKNSAVGDVAEHGVDGERADERARQAPHHPADPDEVDRRARVRRDELHDRQRVRDHGRRDAAVEQRADDVVARVEESMNSDSPVLDAGRRGASASACLASAATSRREANESSWRAERRQDGAAVRAAREAAALEPVEVAAGGHGRDAELLLELARPSPTRSRGGARRSPRGARQPRGRAVLMCSI